MANCNLCKHGKENEDYGHCYNCENGSEFVMITNADRIRSMTDEELAEFFDSHMSEVFEKFNCENCNNRLNCDICYLNWLQKDSEV